MRTKKRGYTISVLCEFSEFSVPPAKDGVIIGKRAPVGMKSLEKAFNAVAPKQFVKIPIEHKIVEGVVIRKAVLRKVPKKRMVEFIINEIEDIMDETDILRFDLNISIRVSEKFKVL